MEIMKGIGIIRKVDELGRIVIPKEIRDRYKIEEGTEIEIFADSNKIILRKNKDTFCPLCKNRMEHTDRFCSKCGFEFDVKEE